jgi:hypothetical protein
MGGTTALPCADTPVEPFPAVACTTRAKSARSSNLELLAKGQWGSFDLAKTYKVIANDFTAGGDNYRVHFLAAVQLGIHYWAVAVA